MKLATTICVFFALCVGYHTLTVNCLEKENTSLKNEILETKAENLNLKKDKKILQQQIKDFENAKDSADKTIQSLRKKAVCKKEIINWYNQPIPNDVINIMRNHHLRDRKTN